MQSLRSLPLRARPSSSLRSACKRQPRRYAHDDHGHGHHSAPKNESFGRGFFITLAALPIGLALYKFTTSDGLDNSYITRWIRSYTVKEEDWRRINATHTAAVELAGNERALFFNGASQENRRVELRFPEALNTGSPYNVPAGHGTSNIDAAIAKYRRLNYEENERKHQQLRDNTVPVEQPSQR